MDEYLVIESTARPPDDDWDSAAVIVASCASDAAENWCESHDATYASVRDHECVWIKSKETGEVVCREVFVTAMPHYWSVVRKEMEAAK